MRCLACGAWSFPYLCRRCRSTLLRPSVRQRILPGGLRVFSFYDYEEIEPLLLSKYEPYGSFLFKTLADLSLRPFFRAYDGEPVRLLPLDDDPARGFSHTALLARRAGSGKAKPLYHALRAGNKVRYAGQSIEFRRTNPREFRYSGPEGIHVVLVDDVVTTGTTLTEAARCLERKGTTPLFAVTLASVEKGN